MPRKDKNFQELNAEEIANAIICDQDGNVVHLGNGYIDKEESTSDANTTIEQIKNNIFSRGTKYYMIDPKTGFSRELNVTLENYSLNLKASDVMDDKYLTELHRNRVDPPVPLTGWEKFVNGLSTIFARKPSARKEAFDRQTQMYNDYQTDLFDFQKAVQCKAHAKDKIRERLTNIKKIDDKFINNLAAFEEPLEPGKFFNKLKVINNLSISEDNGTPYFDESFMEKNVIPTMANFLTALDARNGKISLNNISTQNEKYSKFLGMLSNKTKMDFLKTIASTAKFDPKSFAQELKNKNFGLDRFDDRARYNEELANIFNENTPKIGSNMPKNEMYLSKVIAAKIIFDNNTQKTGPFVPFEKVQDAAKAFEIKLRNRNVQSIVPSLVTSFVNSESISDPKVNSIYLSDFKDKIKEIDKDSAKMSDNVAGHHVENTKTSGQTVIESLINN